MEKQQAVDFITQGLENNLSQAEITAALSQKLKAPPEVVSKFVAQVAATYHPTPASQSDFSASFAPEPVQSAATWTEADYPDSYLDDLDEFPAPPPVSYNSPGPSSTLNPALAMPIAAEGLKSTPPAIPGIPEPPKADAELEALILKALAKGRKESDIVEAVCERTGMSWHEAQRTVARVQSANRKTLASKQAMFLLPLSVMLILVGLGLLGASANEYYSLSTIVLGGETDPSLAIAGTQDAIRILPYAIIGLGLILGGGIGVWRTMSQMNS
jgi:hypothetical protein